MKKILGLLLCTTMFLTALTGCGSKDVKTEITKNTKSEKTKEIELTETDTEHEKVKKEIVNAEDEFNLGMDAYEKEQYEDALKHFLIAAELGSGEACRQLGILYYYGYGVEKDFDKVIEYIEMGIELGNGGCASDLGVLYFKGEHVECNYEKAVAQFEQGVELGDAHATIYLAECYINGIGVEASTEKAVKYYEQGMSMGSGEAAKKVGNLYELGEHVNQDVNKAKEYYEKGISLGNGECACYIANIYAGEGTWEGYEKAAEYYQKAVDLEYASGAYYLGRMYENRYLAGDDGYVDYNKAIEYYDIAIEMGHKTATRTAGLLCYTELKDYDMAWEYLVEARDKGVKDDDGRMEEVLNELRAMGYTEEKNVTQKEKNEKETEVTSANEEIVRVTPQLMEKYGLPGCDIVLPSGSKIKEVESADGTTRIDIYVPVEGKQAEAEFVAIVDELSLVLNPKSDRMGMCQSMDGAGIVEGFKKIGRVELDVEYNGVEYRWSFYMNSGGCSMSIAERAN